MAGSPVGGVLWDLDGTLVDSSSLHWIAWRDTLAAEGRAVSERDFVNSFGKRNDEILRELFGPRVTADWMERVSDTKERAYRHAVRTNGLEPLPGALEWLARLRAAGWRQALATSAPRPNIDAVLAMVDLGRYLDAVVSADEVGYGKPDPALFLESARRLRVPPARCIVVEDAPAGIEGARRARMRSIGVLSSHHPRLSADLVVPSLEALPPDAFVLLLAG
ncbi:MAG: HAD family hydrolase [Betaproteobacteria bacterium]